MLKSLEQFGPSVVYQFNDPPDRPTKDFMEFRLLYWGNDLKSVSRSNTRCWEKHQVRKYLHSQLETLWDTHPLLTFYRKDRHFEWSPLAIGPMPHIGTNIETISKK